MKIGWRFVWFPITSVPIDQLTDNHNFKLLEFWQGQKDRIHDRIVYELVINIDETGEQGRNKDDVNNNNKWTIKRLAP